MFERIRVGLTVYIIICCTFTSDLVYIIILCKFTSDLVEGGFDRLGYIPLADAIEKCDGKARYRVMSVLNRYALSQNKLSKGHCTEISYL